MIKSKNIIKKGGKYITKPFSPKILVARVEAVLRRTSKEEETELLEYGGIVVDKEY